MRYWISWYEFADDYRPLNYPPRKEVLGWWCTGGGGGDKDNTLAACVEADSEETAKKIIESEWPNKDEQDWRFCSDKGDDFVPGDRFPLGDWMKERFEV